MIEECIEMNKTHHRQHKQNQQKPHTQWLHCGIGTKYMISVWNVISTHSPKITGFEWKRFTQKNVEMIHAQLTCMETPFCAFGNPWT